ncbi:chemotaxis protein CheB [Massilia niastensis]|uniref:chemotaxis protein CheB n=1 Tax=Massilia niastensis TaxID=544911 RepID=UPI00037B6E86|nr:chemotaxis protein CheB [Massilia niastensis]
MPKIILIGGSSGSTDPLQVILKALPADFPAAVLIVTHIGAGASILPSMLQRCSALPVRHALQGELLVAGQVLVAPPDLHLTVARAGERAYTRLSSGPKENHSRPAIDPLFRSAATAYGADAIAIVLSGYLDDGTVGLQAIKARGGIAIVQDPGEAEVPDMPASAAAHAAVDYVRRVDDIVPILLDLVRPPAAPGAAEAASALAAQEWIEVENRIFDGDNGMAGLDQLGSRVPLTCPECNGALWEIRDGAPLRYRCHTGHAFTSRVLEALQGGAVEDAMWGAVRALHEQERLLRELHHKSRHYQKTPWDKDDPRNEYLAKAEQVREHAQLLRDLIATRTQILPP